MEVLIWDDFITGALNTKDPVAGSIGVFDGIHVGHRQLLNSIVSYTDKKSIVLTFRENPRTFFNDGTYPGDIFTLSQKLDALSSLGVDIAVLIDFSHNFSKLSGEDFLYLIKNNCNLSYLILGENFRCGHRGMTTAHEACKILESKKVIVDIGEMTRFENQLISSSRIREAVASGNLDKAQKMLKRVFSLDIADIPQIPGDKTITIDIRHIRQVLPPQGHYSVLTGTSLKAQKSKILLRETEIIVPLQQLQHLDFINFILE